MHFFFVLPKNLPYRICHVFFRESQYQKIIFNYISLIWANMPPTYLILLH